MIIAAGQSVPGTSVRDVVVGSGSRVWRAVSAGLGADVARFVGLRHDECARHAWQPGSRVWIFAYARNEADNLRLLQTLRDAAPRCEFIYVSSSSCIVTVRTGCYAYPRVKQRCAEAARRLLGARVVTLGLIHERLDDLPRGANAATSIDQLRQFMLAPAWTADRGNGIELFSIVTRPFRNHAEAALYRAYGLLLRACGPWPCLLRPLDALLRTSGIRWYGYTYLSNRLWTAKS